MLDMSASNDKYGKIRLLQCGGANISKSKTIFTPDSKYICCCSGNSVKVISVSSGECVRELVGHCNEVTCVKTNPSNVLQVYTSSKDRTVKQWDYQDGVVLKSFNIKKTLSVFYPVGNAKDTLIALTGSKVVQLDLGKELTNKPLFDGITDSNKALSLGCGNTLVAAIKSYELVCYSLQTRHTQCHSLKRSARAHFTCVQCHPTEACVATGSNTGKIHVWRDVLQTPVVMAIYHWHHAAVADLEYTTQGSYLLSGGQECVMVKWQHSSDDRDFLPRLEAPINFITSSPDNALYAVVHTDNAIQLVSSNFELLHQYQGLTRAFLPHHITDPCPTGLLVDPKTGALVLSGRPGHLQFYDIHHDRQMYNLDITCENYIAANELGGPEYCTEVTRAAFDDRGDLLVTVETWDDGVMSPEIRLKFWHDTDGDGSFSLNTCVELPHNKVVNCVEFRPSLSPATGVAATPSATLVTTSNDGKFKLWSLVDDTDIHRVNTKWECEAVGFYRDLPATACAFSQDGSLLAVVFESSVTLWDPDTNAMKTSLSHAQTRPVTSIKFGLHACCHLLLSSTSSQLTVWNLLTCTADWTVSVDIKLYVTADWTVSVDTSLIVTDPLSDFVAVVTTNETLHVFRPSNPVPLYTRKNVGDIVAAIFVPRPTDDSDTDQLPWQHNSRLYLMNRGQDLFTLTTKDGGPKTSQHLSIGEENLPVAPMSLFMGGESRSGVVRAPHMENIPTTVTDPAGDADFFACPTHVLPATSQLCGHFIKRLLDLNIQPEKSANAIPDDDDDDDDEAKHRTPQPHSDSDDSDVMEISMDMTETPAKTTKIVDDAQDNVTKTCVTEEELKIIKRITKHNYDWLCVQ